MSFLTGLFGGSDSSATTPTAVTPAATSNTGGGFMDTLNSWDNSFNEWSNNAESGINSWFGNLFGGNDPDNTGAKATNTDTNGPSLGDYVSEGAQSFTQGMNQGQSQAQAAPLNVQATQPMQVAQLQASPMMAEQTPLNNEAVATPAPAPAPVQSLAVVQPTQGMVQSDPNAQLGAQIAGVATPTQTMGQPGAIQPQQVQATQQQQN
uniref:hypothetical protein n=1 Tax=Thalassospira alkalitolerans TaxID=1293890 RepID=UPI003AA9C084